RRPCPTEKGSLRRGGYVSAPVLLVAILGRVRANRAGFAETDDGELRLRDSHCAQEFFRRLGAAIAEREIILVRSALVAMAFDKQLLRWEIRQHVADYLH